MGSQILERRRFGRLQKGSVPLVIQVSTPISERNTDKTFWVPRFQDASFAQMPVGVSGRPFVKGPYVRGKAEWVPFDFGRFLDVIERDNGHLRRAEGSPSLPVKIGPLGRRTLTLTRVPTESDLAFTEERVSNQIASEILRSGSRLVGSYWDAYQSWDDEIEAIRSCLAVHRLLVAHRESESAFLSIFRQVGDVMVFTPPPELLGNFGEMDQYTLSKQIARSFWVHLSADDRAVAEKDWTKRYESRKLSKRQTFKSAEERENSILRYCCWLLLRRTIECYLEGQVSGRVRLAKDPTKVKDREKRPASGFSDLRPNSLAGILWLSVLNFINGQVAVHTCSICEKRYSLAGHQISARAKKYIDDNTGEATPYCGREISRACYEAVRKRFKHAKKA